MNVGWARNKSVFDNRLTVDEVVYSIDELVLGKQLYVYCDRIRKSNGKLLFAELKRYLTVHVDLQSNIHCSCINTFEYAKMILASDSGAINSGHSESVPKAEFVFSPVGLHLKL